MVIKRRTRLETTPLIAIAVAFFVGCGSRDRFHIRATEGRGLLPRPAMASNSSAGPAPMYVFHKESSGLFSRLIFETDEDPRLKISVREFSLPPGRGPVTLSFAGAAVLEMRTDRGRLSLGAQPEDWRQGTSIMVPEGTPIGLANPTDRELIVRLCVLEAK